jgi:hypothetical protein
MLERNRMKYKVKNTVTNVKVISYTVEATSKEEAEEIIKDSIWETEDDSELKQYNPTEEYSDGITSFEVEEIKEIKPQPILFKLDIRGAYAKGTKLNNGIVVHAGAKIRYKENISFKRSGMKKYRDLLIKEGKIVNNILVETVAFTSFSNAASVLTGCCINGKTAWIPV